MAFETTGLGVFIDPTGAEIGAARVNAALDTMAARGRLALNSLDTGIGRVSRTVFSLRTAMVGLGAALSLGLILREFAQFEQALIGVGKTTDLAGTELDRLGQRIQEISRTVPVATTELLGIAQAAGQLGVKGVENIALFAETVGKLGLASDLAGEEAATALARILTVSGTAISEVDRLGSTIVRMGNNFAATEAEIAAVATRVAQATASFSQFGVTAADIIGISTAFRAVGVEAELAGSVTSRVFAELNTAVRQGGENMEVLQRITGQTAEQLREAFFTDATSVFEDFMLGLGRIAEVGGDVTAVLNRMGLEGVRVEPILGTLAARTDVLTDALSQAGEEWQANAALTKEALTAATSFTSQMRLMLNAVDEAAVEIGRALAPTIVELAQSFRDWVLAAKESGQLVGIAERIGAAFAMVADNIDIVIGAMGALMGMQFGAVLGPWGALIGAVVGGLASWGTYAYAASGATDELGTSVRDRTTDLQGLYDILVLTNEQLGALGENSIETAIAQTEQQIASLRSRADTLMQMREWAREQPDQFSDPGTFTFNGVSIPTGPLTLASAQSNDPNAPGILGAGSIRQLVEQSVELENQLPRLQAALAATTTSTTTLGTSMEDAAGEVEDARVRLDEHAAVMRRLHGVSTTYREGLQEEADTLRNELMTPQDVYLRNIERASELLRIGAIDQATYNGAMRLYGEQLREATDKTRDLEEATTPMQRAMEQAASGIQGAFADAFEDVLEDGEASFGDLRDAALRVMRRTAAEIAAMLVFRPVVGTALSSLGMGGLSQGLFGSGGAGGGGMGGLGSLFGGSGGGLGGLTSAINSIGSSLGFASAPSVMTSVGTGGGAFAAGVAGPPALPTGMFGTGATFAGTLGAAGIGAMGGGLLASLIGGNTTGGSIGGALGAGLGFMIGGPVGGLIGGTAGSLFGSFLGGSGKSVGANAAARIGGNETSGFILGGTGADNGGELGPVIAEANNAIGFLNALREQYGLTITESPASLFPGRNYIGSGAAAKGFSSSTAFVDALLKAGGLAGEEPIITNALKVSTSSNVEENLAAAMAIADLLGGESANDNLTAAEQALAALNAQFDELTKKAIEFGVTATELETARENAIQALTDGFDESILAQIRAITDPVGAAFDALAQQQADRLREAEALGADLVEVERLALLERNALIAEFTRAANDNIEALLFEMTGTTQSPLAPGDVLANAESHFNSLIEAARDGDIQARNDLAGAAANLLDVSRDIFASSAQFFERFNFVQATLESVLGEDIPGFASGGRVKVRPGGAPDSRLFMARVSPNEEITFRTQGEQDEAASQADSMRAMVMLIEQLLRVTEEQAGQIERLNHHLGLQNSRLERIAASVKAAS